MPRRSSFATVDGEQPVSLAMALFVLLCISGDKVNTFFNGNLKNRLNDDSYRAKAALTTHSCISHNAR